MAYARIITRKNGTIIRNVNLVEQPVQEVDRVALLLDSIIANEQHILRVEVDYEGCVEGIEYEH